MPLVVWIILGLVTWAVVSCLTAWIVGAGIGAANRPSPAPPSRRIRRGH